MIVITHIYTLHIYYIVLILLLNFHFIDNSPSHIFVDRLISSIKNCDPHFLSPVHELMNEV